MGWLDMSFDEAMKSDCLAILLGQQARIDYLVATGVLQQKEEPAGQLPPLRREHLRGIRRG